MKKTKPLKKISSKLRKEDTVMIIAGKEKGRSGKILNIDNVAGRVTIEGRNIRKKTIKKSEKTPSGGIIEKEVPIHISNVMYLEDEKPTRLGYKVEKKDNKNKKLRVSKKSGKVL